MVQEKQLRELFKYIEQNWHVCVSQVDKTDIKRIFGGVLCEDIMNDTDQVTDQVAEPEELKGNCTTFDMSRLVDEEYKPALNPIEEAYERGEKIRMKEWPSNLWIMKHTKTEAIDELKNTYDVTNWAMKPHPEKWELYTEPTDQVPDQVTDHEQPQEKPQPDFNPIEQAYHNYEPIRYKKWEKFQWIKKHSEFEAKTEDGAIFYVVSLNFNTHPQLWELYTEPAGQMSSQAKLDNSFDRERFEAMFRAVVASGKNEHWEEDISVAKWAIEQLDAYYASKEGGSAL